MTDRSIKTRAYQLWEDAGRPEGQSDNFWQQAERELRTDRPNTDDFGEEASATKFTKDMSGPTTDETVADTGLSAMEPLSKK